MEVRAGRTRIRSEYRETCLARGTANGAVLMEGKELVKGMNGSSG